MKQINTCISGAATFEKILANGITFLPLNLPSPVEWEAQTPKDPGRVNYETHNIYLNSVKTYGR